jgi:hypothetical protein
MEQWFGLIFVALIMLGQAILAWRGRKPKARAERRDSRATSQQSRGARKTEDLGRHPRSTTPPPAKARESTRFVETPFLLQRSEPAIVGHSAAPSLGRNILSERVSLRDAILVSMMVDAPRALNPYRIPR